MDNFWLLAEQLSVTFTDSGVLLYVREQGSFSGAGYRNLAFVLLFAGQGKEHLRCNLAEKGGAM